MAYYIRSSLLPCIEEYLRVTGTAATYLGLAALNDPHFIFELRGGRQPQHATAHRLIDYVMADMERRIAEGAQRKKREDCLGDLRAIMDEADTLGVDLINRTVLVPIPIISGSPQLRVVGGYA